MFEQERKNKIVNTISQYKHKCDKLEDEINVLKSAIYQSPQLTVDSQINARLNQIIEHLLIPDVFATKLAALKSNLTQQLTIESLTNVIDNLTDLVIEAFNLEHYKFKECLNTFVTYLQDFNSGLQLSMNNNLQFQTDTKQLEAELQDSIQTIKCHIDQSKTIGELTGKIEGNLELMTDQIKSYREKESKRIDSYEEKIRTMQAKLNETELNVEKIKNQLSSHKIQVNQDFLTGLPNRLAYDDYVVKVFHRWQRGFGEISLALADIDHFKEINSKYGYQAGDKILKKIAKIFKSTLRTVDFIARYGGGEFVFILERTAVHDAWKVFENLQVTVEETAFCYGDSKIVVTASFGLTSLQHGDDIKTFFARAEEAKSRAKHRGRNQVILLNGA